jgi:hypothetical protein
MLKEYLSLTFHQVVILRHFLRRGRLFDVAEASHQDVLSEWLNVGVVEAVNALGINITAWRIQRARYTHSNRPSCLMNRILSMVIAA